MDLKHSSALITGGAHRVGKGIAVELAKKGTNLVLHYGRSVEQAKNTQAELIEYGVEVALISSDLRENASIKSMMSSLSSTHDINILVNSAASFVRQKFESTTFEQFEQALSVNLRAPYFLSQLTLPSLVKHDDALIVNISDLSGVYPWDQFSAHGLSKAGLIHLTKSLAREIAPVRVNAIIPGPILPPPGMSPDHPSWQEMIQNIPLKRSGRPSDIGKTVVYLAESDFVTGSIIHVDGGEGLVGPKNH